jgi:hypothetical protein
MASKFQNLVLYLGKKKFIKLEKPWKGLFFMQLFFLR